MKVKNELILGIVIILPLLFSCNSNKKFLTNGNQKYWDIIEMPGFYSKQIAKDFPVFGYYFNEEGYWEFYQYDKGQRKKYSNDDVYIPNTWKIKNDSILLLGGYNYTITKLTGDTLELKSNEGIIKLISSTIE